MAIYMCPKCKNIFKSDYLMPTQDEYGNISYYCPNAKCLDTKLFEVDELMARPIQILNQKGYKTRFCCSGHSYEKYEVTGNIPYIMFDGLYKFPNLPKKWSQDFRTDFSRKFDKITTLQTNCRDKYIYMRNLEHWVDKLPYNEEKEKEDDE